VGIACCNVAMLEVSDMTPMAKGKPLTSLLHHIKVLKLKKEKKEEKKKEREREIPGI